MVTGLVAVGLVGVVVAVPRPAAPPTRDVSGVRLVAVDPPRSTLVCPGPLVLPAAAGSDGSAFASTPVAPVERVDAVTAPGADPAGDVAGGPVAPGSVRPIGAPDVTAVLDADTPHARVEAPTSPVVVAAEPVEGIAPLVAAATSSLVSAGDLRGLSAASCQRPQAELWLVGGSTELSSEARVVVANAGSTASDVTLTIWGPAGQVEQAGSAHLLVAPGAQQVVSLPAVAAEQRRLVVRLEVAGGTVAAHLQDSRLNGFTPQGTDLVSPGAAPAPRQVVTGLVVGGSTVDDPDAAVLRLLAPGDAGGTAQVTLLGPDGPVLLAGADLVDLLPGEVLDVPLGGLPAGAYTAVVDAPVPVVAAGMVTRPGLASESDDTPTLERAWSASTFLPVGPPAGQTASSPADPPAVSPAGTPVAAGGGAVAVPGGVLGTLVVGAVGDGDDLSTGAAGAVLRVLGPTGKVTGERAIRVAAGRTVALSLAELGEGATGVVLVPDGSADGASLVWALVAEVDQADGRLVSVLAPTRVATTSPEVPVRSGSRLGLS